MNSAVGPDECDGALAVDEAVADTVGADAADALGRRTVAAARPLGDVVAATPSVDGDVDGVFACRDAAATGPCGAWTEPDRSIVVMTVGTLVAIAAVAMSAVSLTEPIPTVVAAMPPAPGTGFCPSSPQIASDARAAVAVAVLHSRVSISRVQSPASDSPSPVAGAGSAWCRTRRCLASARRQARQPPAPSPPPNTCEMSRLASPSPTTSLRGAS